MKKQLRSCVDEESGADNDGAGCVSVAEVVWKLNLDEKVDGLRCRIDYDALVVEAKRSCVTRFLFLSSWPSEKSGMSALIRKWQESARYVK